MKMKCMKKLLVSLLTMTTAVGMLSVTAMAKNSYSYQVTVYAGNKGTIDGQDAVVTTDLAKGTTYSFDINSVQVTDEKYYVKGIRLSGRDNDEALAAPAVNVTADTDYVIAYGIKGEMVKYTVNFQDANGNTLAESREYYGNVGDKPVVAYQYIDGYTPNALAITKTLVKDESENVFTFTYTQGAQDQVVTVTDTVTTVVPVYQGAADANAGTGTGANAGAGTGANAGTGAGGTTAGGTDANAGGTDANAGGTDETGADDTVVSEDEDTPQDLVDLDDEDTPQGNIDADNAKKAFPLAAGIGIACAAVAALIVILIAAMKKRKGEKAEK